MGSGSMGGTGPGHRQRRAYSSEKGSIRGGVASYSLVSFTTAANRSFTYAYAHAQQDSGKVPEAKYEVRMKTTKALASFSYFVLRCFAQRGRVTFGGSGAGWSFTNYNSTTFARGHLQPGRAEQRPRQLYVHDSGDGHGAAKLRRHAHHELRLLHVERRPGLPRSRLVLHGDEQRGLAAADRQRQRPDAGRPAEHLVAAVDAHRHDQSGDRQSDGPTGGAADAGGPAGTDHAVCDGMDHDAAAGAAAQRIRLTAVGSARSCRASAGR